MAAVAGVVRRAWCIALAALLLVFPVSSAAPTARTILVFGANRSFNWAGYMQGSLEKGTTFHAVSAEWIVPRAKPHRHGEAEHSLSWIGIGGCCLDSDC